VTGDEEEPPPYEVLAALLASLRRELPYLTLTSAFSDLTNQA
jgi:hypothetical protein